MTDPHTPADRDPVEDLSIALVSELREQIPADVDTEAIAGLLIQIACRAVIGAVHHHQGTLTLDQMARGLSSLVAMLSGQLFMSRADSGEALLGQVRLHLAGLDLERVARRLVQNDVCEISVGAIQ